MFTGNIEVKCEDTALTINATYWTDLEIDYSEIETIEYRKNLDVGVRTSGLVLPNYLWAFSKMMNLDHTTYIPIQVLKSILS